MTETNAEKEKKGVCPDCNGLIKIRNPTGKCDHLYYPEYKNKPVVPLLEKIDERINALNHIIPCELWTEEGIENALTECRSFRLLVVDCLKELKNELYPSLRIYALSDDNIDMERVLRIIDSKIKRFLGDKK